MDGYETDNFIDFLTFSNQYFDIFIKIFTSNFLVMYYDLKKQNYIL